MYTLISYHTDPKMMPVLLPVDVPKINNNNTDLFFL